MGGNEPPVPPGLHCCLLEQVVVGGYDAFLTRDEGGTHRAAHLLAGLQACLLFPFHPAFQLVAVPELQGFGQPGGALLHGPGGVPLRPGHARRKQLVAAAHGFGQLNGHEVGLPFLQCLDQGGGVVVERHPQANADGCGEVFGQGILQAHGRALVIKVSVGTADGGDDELASLDDALHIGFFRLARLGKCAVTRRRAALWLVGTGQKATRQEEGEKDETEEHGD